MSAGVDDCVDGARGRVVFGLLTQLDARMPSKEAEGESGFVLPHLRLGVGMRPMDKWLAVVVLDATTSETVPLLVDGCIAYMPTPEWRLLAGYSKKPLFISARDETLASLTLPERSLTSSALSPGRDLGIEGQYRSRLTPVEAWLRIGNGGGGLAGNDKSTLSVDARLDGAWGRARPMEAEAKHGFRVGAGLHLKDAFDRAGVTGTTAGGFVFYRAPTVQGLRGVAEAHALALIGPVRLLAEGGFARESRSQSPDGNPETPRVPLPAVNSWGGSVEAVWAVRGPAPYAGNGMMAELIDKIPPRGGAVELAVRSERLSLGQDASDLTPGGAWGSAVAVKWWATDFLSATAAGYYARYDRPPPEESRQLDSWLLMLRLTGTLR